MGHPALFIGPRLSTSYGAALTSEPHPIRLPRDRRLAHVMAGIADRAAEEAARAGRFAAADRLAGLVIELRARAAGARA